MSDQRTEELIKILRNFIQFDGIMWYMRGFRFENNPEGALVWFTIEELLSFCQNLEDLEEDMNCTNMIMTIIAMSPHLKDFTYILNDDEDNIVQYLREFVIPRLMMGD